MPKPRRNENLPATSEQDPNAIAQSFHPDAGDLKEKYDQLRAETMGPIKAAMALEFSIDAKRYLELVDASELRIQAKRLWDSHRTWNKVYKVARAPGELLLKYCVESRSEWEGIRQAHREKVRQEKEQQAKLFATKQREAEVAHLHEIGRDEEANLRATAPITVPTVSVDPNLGKPAGEIIVEVWRPKRDENGDFVFRQGADDDEAAFRRWITENVAMWHLQSYEYGKTKTLLTDNRGMLQPPGLEIEHIFEPRTRRSDE
jgi:hypothetical protein